MPHRAWWPLLLLILPWGWVLRQSRRRSRRRPRAARGRPPFRAGGAGGVRQRAGRAVAARDPGPARAHARRKKPRQAANIFEETWRQFLEQRFGLPVGLADLRLARPPAALRGRGRQMPTSSARLTEDLHYLRYAPRALLHRRAAGRPARPFAAPAQGPHLRKEPAMPPTENPPAHWPAASGPGACMAGPGRARARSARRAGRRQPGGPGRQARPGRARLPREATIRRPCTPPSPTTSARPSTSSAACPKPSSGTAAPRPPAPPTPPAAAAIPGSRTTCCWPAAPWAARTPAIPIPGPSSGAMPRC